MEVLAVVSDAFKDGCNELDLKNDPRIQRLNELAQKNRDGNISDEEFIEQHELYAWYVDEIKKNLESQLQQMGFKRRISPREVLDED